jgi:hypothetical protein
LRQAKLMDRKSHKQVIATVAQHTDEKIVKIAGGPFLE